MDEGKQLPSNIKEIEHNGYRFAVDTDLLDDVEAFEYIDRIENKKQVAAIVPLLKYLIGVKAFDAMQVHYTKEDAMAHKDTPDYKARFRVSTLSEIYASIVAQFDPKG